MPDTSIFGRNFICRAGLIFPLRSLKYLLLAFFVWAVAKCRPVVEQFMRSPYGAVADVRMLNFFRDLGQTAAIVLVHPGSASILVQNFWCRYFVRMGRCSD